MKTTIDELKTKVIPILQSNDVEFAGVFGSYARGEAKEESDIDLLIRYAQQKQKSLLDLVALQRKLSERLNSKVDLLTEASVSPYIKEDVMKDLIVFYGQRQVI